MKKLLLLFILYLSCMQLQAQETDVSTYYFIRHAEKERSNPTDRNPELTEKGHERAAFWSSVFKNVKFDLVMSTDYNRTRQTAMPTAEKQGLTLELYDPRKPFSEELAEKTKGKTVLIVGHSNTTPALVNQVLGHEKYKDIDDKNNANLYILTSKDGKFTDVLLYINP